MSDKKKKETVDVFEETNESTKKKAELEVLKEEAERLFKEKEELNTKYLMALAEQKNYKKRLDDEMERFYKYSSSPICLSLLQVLDGFDIAIEKDSKDESMKSYLDGFKMIRNQLFSILEKEGVKEVESIGKEFDPNTMNAIAQVNDPTKKDQEVVNNYLKGYMYKDRVLRPAQVIVNVLANKEQEENKEE